jgi:hypothetical protein
VYLDVCFLGYVCLGVCAKVYMIIFVFIGACALRCACA